jgi:hypothetical protein
MQQIGATSRYVQAHVLVAQLRNDSQFGAQGFTWQVHIAASVSGQLKGKAIHE